MLISFSEKSENFTQSKIKQRNNIKMYVQQLHEFNIVSSKNRNLELDQSILFCLFMLVCVVTDQANIVIVFIFFTVAYLCVVASNIFLFL